MSQPAIEIEGLWKRFRKGGHERLLWEMIQKQMRRALQRKQPDSDTFWALQDINLSVKPGEAVGIIGPNGAGKSTMLKVLSRVLKPDRGRMQVNGRLSGLIEVGAGFHGDLSGRENVFINGAILGMTRHEIRRKFDQIVEFSGIGEFLDMPVKRYSSGMYVRLGFSIAAHMEPEVLLVDEVLSVGDIQFKAKCMEAMRNFLKRGTSILFVSHNLSSIKRFCDRVILLDHGQIRFEGYPDDAIAEYSRLVSDLEHANPTGYDHSHIGGKTLSGGPVSIEHVRVLDQSGQRCDEFSPGEPLKIEIDYNIAPSTGGIDNPNFSIAVHMFGAGQFFGFDARRDGADFGHCIGRGTVAVNLPSLALGEGVYQISVAVADEKGLPKHDWHDRAYRIQVIADGKTDGPVYQARKWSQKPAQADDASQDDQTDMQPALDCTELEV